ncbi:ABC transporter substrate-binding protein [Candidatus Poriferisodalis sp.]|uniref:ABC transporter substrate-binding protein n=1 Tax=Candidatus Poriferisodalis sp. TaxID=3101277 RepID=UPI003B02DAA7
MKRPATSRAALRLRLLWALAAVLLLASACGGDDSDSSPTAAPATDSAPAAEAPSETQAPTTTTETAAAETADESEEAAETVEETDDTEPAPAEPAYRYQRIVSISPTGTEILFAIGAGDRVVAVDEFSYYPSEAPVTDLSGWQPNVEAIASYDPDLVVMGSDGDIEANLESLGIAVLSIDAPATFDELYAQIAQFGDATEQADEAVALISEMRSEIAALIDAAPDASGLTYYHELTDGLYSVTSSTFIGQVYSLFGLDNIADPADSDGSSYGYPQLSDEYIVDADPDLIFLADTLCCGQNAETVAARPGWDLLSAVQNGRVVELNDDIVSRWGPRLVEFIAAISDAVVSIGAAS